MKRKIYKFVVVLVIIVVMVMTVVVALIELVELVGNSVELNWCHITWFY